MRVAMCLLCHFILKWAVLLLEWLSLEGILFSKNQGLNWCLCLSLEPSCSFDDENSLTENIVSTALCHTLTDRHTQSHTLSPRLFKAAKIFNHTFNSTPRITVISSESKRLWQLMCFKRHSWKYVANCFHFWIEFRIVLCYKLNVKTGSYYTGCTSQTIVYVHFVYTFSAF